MLDLAYLPYFGPSIRNLTELARGRIHDVITTADDDLDALCGDSAHVASALNNRDVAAEDQRCNFHRFFFISLRPHQRPCRAFPRVPKLHICLPTRWLLMRVRRAIALWVKRQDAAFLSRLSSRSALFACVFEFYVVSRLADVEAPALQVSIQRQDDHVPSVCLLPSPSTLIVKLSLRQDGSWLGQQPGESIEDSHSYIVTVEDGFPTIESVE